VLSSNCLKKYENHIKNHILIKPKNELFRHKIKMEYSIVDAKNGEVVFREEKKAEIRKKGVKKLV
jgi:hypothetical protein